MDYDRNINKASGRQVSYMEKPDTFNQANNNNNMPARQTLHKLIILCSTYD